MGNSPAGARNYTTQERILPCDACGEPIATPIAGGTTGCPRCSAPFAAYARPDTQIPPSPPSDENARRERLRLQDGKPLLPPPGFEGLVTGSEVPPHREQEAFSVWSGTRRQLLQQPYDMVSADRLSWLTLMLRNTYQSRKQDPTVERRIRALLEGAVESFSIPRHRQGTLGHLARGAVREHDLESASAWLAMCDPRSEDLPADSAYRISKAFLDTARSDFASVLNELGGDNQQVPVDDSMDGIAVVLRANAWEKQGRVDTATEVLRQFMAKHGSFAVVVENLVVAMPAELRVCVQSLPAAKQGVRQAVAQRASSAGGGAMMGYIVMAAGCIPLIVLTVLVISGQFQIFMLFMFVFPVVFGSMGYKMVQASQRAEEIAKTGLRGRGKVIATHMTGTRINGVPMIRIVVSVQIEGRPPITAETKRLMFPQQLAGQELPVMWHPKYPTEVVLEV